jgi:hypothetical protein
MGVITNSLDGACDNSVNGSVVETVELSTGCFTEIVKLRFCSSPKKRRAFLKIFVSEEGLDLFTPVINERAEVKIVELIEESECACVWPTKPELDGGFAAERCGVFEAIEFVNLAGRSFDDLLSTAACEDGVVRVLDVLNERVGELIPVSEVRSCAIAQILSNAIKRIVTSIVRERPCEREILINVLVE